MHADFVHITLNNNFYVHSSLRHADRLNGKTYSRRFLGIQIILPLIKLSYYLAASKVLVTADRSHSVWILSQYQIPNNCPFVIVVVITGLKWKNSAHYATVLLRSLVKMCTRYHFTVSFYLLIYYIFAFWDCTCGIWKFPG